MTKDDFENAVRSANERHDGIVDKLYRLEVKGEISPVIREREYIAERSEHYLKLRTLVNDFLYGVKHPFIYYPELDKEANNG